MILSDAIINARNRIHSFVTPTKCIRSVWLSTESGANVYLKCEHKQLTGSFKIRGAANKLLLLSPEERERGVITASNGNHALAVATMGRRLGIATDVLVSATIDENRLRVIEERGAKVRKLSGDCLDAETIARREAEATQRTYISPYNDFDVIAGQGTIAIEVMDQVPQPDAIFASVGGGGLIAGIGAYLKAVSPATVVAGCWPRNSPALHTCLQMGRILEVPEKPTLSTSTAGGIEPGAVTFALGQQVIDQQILVTELEILSALRRLHRAEGYLVEGAAGVAIAAFLKMASAYAGRTVVIVLCGGNVSFAMEALIQEHSITRPAT